MNANLEKAIELLNQGFCPIPLQYRGKKPVISQWKWLQNRKPRPEELTWMFGNHRGNIGLVCGHDNLVVLDFDDMTAFITWWQATKITTFMVRSNRGVHVYFKLSHIPASVKIPGVLDVIAKGYVVAAGSIHPSGAVYQVFCTAPIAMFEKIDAVLTADLLTQYVVSSRPMAARPQPPILSCRAALGAAPIDPWQAAANPYGGGLDPVSTIRQRIPILSFFPDAKPTGGGWYIARCVLHDDHNPSMSINPQNGTCKCLANCHGVLPLDVINLYARLHGIDNRAAIQELRRMI